MKKPFSERFGDFMAGKGFYIVLFLCVAAIGISGYYLFSSLTPDQDPSTAVGGPAQVTVTPTPRPTPGTPSPKPPVVTPRPTVEPTQAPAVAVTAVPTAEPASPAPKPAETPAPQTAPTAFTWPVRGETLTDYSMQVLAYDATMGDWRAHQGVDIAAPAGEQVLAAARGVVIDVVQDDLMGTTVYVDHGGGLASSYSNLAAVPAVEVGDTVNAGDVLGSVGASAIAESALPSHLHFAMSQDGAPVDPLEYLS